MHTRDLPTIGIIAAGAAASIEGFVAGMRECDFVEEENVRFERRVAHGVSARLLSFATELVELEVDLIAVVGAVTARAARAATANIPIVYAVVVDPVGDGLATKAGSPLGNMTGLTTFDVAQAPAQLTLLRSIEPDLSQIAFLADASVTDCLADANMIAAHEAGMQSQIVRIADVDTDLEGALATMQRSGAQALIVLEHPLNGANAAFIAKLALARGLPTIMARQQASAGGLFSYGTDLSGAARRLARYAGRILRGAAPSDLRIGNYSRPELVVNLVTARRLGVTVPREILTRALNVIR